jgi:TatD DNase family protein
MLVDTHCHLLDLENFADAMRRARDAGVGAIVCATAEPADWAPTIALCEEHENIFCTIGIHPEYSDKAAKANFPSTDHPKIIGIGEIGLDYHYGEDNKKHQAELFEYQLDIALRAEMPVAIHTRDAEGDTARILKAFCDSAARSGPIPRAPGVMHCFTGSWEFAKKMLDLGFYFSASGILTFKNASELRETFARIPPNRIVVETDAPYCAPAPYRGKICEPFMIAETAKILAEAKGIPLTELEKVLEENTKKLYPKIMAVGDLNSQIWRDMATQIPNQ